MPSLKPPPSPTHLRPLLQELHQGLKRLYGPQLTHLILFGSHARQQATPDSDIDILVVLQGNPSPGDEILKMGQLKSQLNLKYNELISVIPVSESDYRHKETPLLLNIRQEGIEL